MLSKNKIKFLQSLQRKKNRDENKLFLAESEKLISQLMESSFPIDTIIHTKALPAGLINADIKYIECDAHTMKQISQLKTPQAFIAVCKIPEYNIIFKPKKEALYLALADIQDPGNMGTIIRIASWFGITDIICSGNTVDCYNSKVIQASMGAISNVRIHYLDLAQVIQSCIDDDIPVYGTFMEGHNLYDSKLTKGGMIVLGNEGKGIPDELSKQIPHRLSIPDFASMGSQVESLNVSVAGAIICSEFRRRSG